MKCQVTMNVGSSSNISANAVSAKDDDDDDDVADNDAYIVKQQGQARRVFFAK